MKGLHMVAFILVVIGALNWGLVGFFGFNLVEWALGSGGVARVIYALVGISAIVELIGHKASCKACKSGM